MAVDPFTQAGSGLGAGYSKSDYDYAFYSARSGLAKGTLADHKAAYYRNALAITSDIDYLKQQFKASGISAKRTNHIPNPSAVVAPTNSTVTGSGLGVTLTRDSTPRAGFSQTFKLVPDGNSNPIQDNWMGFGDTGSFTLGMAPGSTYTASGTLILPAPLIGNLGSRSLRIVAFYQQGGNYVEVDGTPAPNVAGTYRLSVTISIPVDATEAFVRFYHGSDSTSDIVYWAGLMLEQSSTVGSYFDGSSPGCSWDGTANASTSSGYPGVSQGVRFTETFTGTNGAAWPAAWSSSDLGSSTIQANKGRATTSAARAYLAHRMYPSTSSYGNIDFSGTFTAVASGIEQYVNLAINSNGVSTDPGDSWIPTGCYAAFITYSPTPASGRLALSQFINNAENHLGSAVPVTLTGGVTYGFRFQRVGQVLNFRVWDASGAEPGTWNLTYTLTVTPLVGGVCLSPASGATSAAVSVDFDDLVVGVP